MKTARNNQPTANDVFIGRCLEFDELMKKLNALRADHFGVDGERGANWGNVGDVGYVVEKLQEAMNHFVPEDEPIYSWTYINGRRVRVCIPPRD